MTNWVCKIDVSDVFCNEDMTYEERRDAIVQRFQNHPQLKLDEELMDLVGELAHQEDPDEFNFVWDEIYDWADTNLTWIGTF